MLRSPGDQEGPAAGHSAEPGFLQGGLEPGEAQRPDQRLRLRGGPRGAAQPGQAPGPPGEQGRGQADCASAFRNVRRRSCSLPGMQAGIRVRIFGSLCLDTLSKAVLGKVGEPVCWGAVLLTFGWEFLLMVSSRLSCEYPVSPKDL